MLVCSVSLRAARSAIAADLAEAAAAVDGLATGFAVFATLVDDPASVNDIVDAYSGEIMLEAASAAAVADASIPAVYAADVVEAATAADTSDGSAAIAYASFDGTNSSQLTLSNSNRTVRVNSSVSISGVRSASLQSTGKFYFEMKMEVRASGGFNNAGILLSTATYNNMDNGQNASVVASSDGSIYTNNAGSQGSPLGAVAVNDVLSFAVDLTARKFWARKNGGNWNSAAIGSQNPATGTGGWTIATGSFAPALNYDSFPSVNDGWTANFGASTFAYAVPSGFTAGWPL